MSKRMRRTRTVSASPRNSELCQLARTDTIQEWLKARTQCTALSSKSVFTVDNLRHTEASFCRMVIRILPDRFQRKNPSDFRYIYTERNAELKS